MAYAANGSVSLYYETEGDGDTVAFLGEIGYGAWQWSWQHAAVAGPRESLVADVRGAGRSDAPPGPYAPADLAADAEAVLADRGARTAHLVGAGLGGAVALTVARRSGRVDSLTLIGTSARGSDVDAEALYAPPDDPEALRASLDPALSAAFRDARPDALDRIVEWRAAGDADRAAWEAQAAALAEFDLADSLYEVTVPALVVHGTADAVCPVECGRALAEGLPRGEFLPVDGAGHLAHVERSKLVNDRLLGFLDGARA